MIVAFRRGRGYRVDMSSDESQVKLFMAKIAADSLYKKETPEQWLARLERLRELVADEIDVQVAAVNS